MNAPAIEAKRLKKVFAHGTGFLDVFSRNAAGRKRTLALDGVDLCIAPGEIFALLGPNGAGKTTLIKVLAGLVLADAGEASIFGHDIRRDFKKAHALMSLVLGEERSFYWRLTGRQNLDFFAALYNLSGKNARNRIETAVAFVGLRELDMRYQEYSTGNKSRLALARSFLNDARLLFMDEPTKSLDPSAAANLRSLVRDLSRKEGKTIFFTTHDTREAEEIADRMAVIDRGRIKGLGTLKEIRAQASAPSASLAEIFGLLTGAS